MGRIIDKLQSRRESLKQIFSFDYQIDTPYGTRKYEITKKNNFTNGILLGVFFVQNYLQMGTTTIKIYESNNNENDSDSDKSDSDESESSKSDNNDNDDDGLSGGAIFGIIVANLFIDCSFIYLKKSSEDK